MNIHLSDYICGGYLLTRPVNRKTENPTFPIDEIVSISRDVCNFLPDAWALDWAKGTEEESENVGEKIFGLNHEQLREVTEWANKNFGIEFGAWYVIYRLETARFLKDKFLNHLPDSKLLGIGLHKTIVAEFLKKIKAPPSEPGFAPNGEAGVYEVVIESRPLENGGKPLGFEPVVAELNTKIALSCSWLCNHLEIDADKNKIRINELGLIDDFESASRLTTLINVGKINAEPGLWVPWLLVDYTVS